MIKEDILKQIELIEKEKESVKQEYKNSIKLWTCKKLQLFIL